MNNWPTLSKAPIVEGLIDIRVEQSPSATIDALKAAADDLAADFPSRQDLNIFVAQFNLSPDPSATTLVTGDTPKGIILRSADEKWVAQFRLDGFTVSRLHPYGSWNELIAKASTLWAIYSTATKPNNVVRIASRFINRVQLPVGEPFDKTFQTNFVIAPTLPQTVACFLLRVFIPFEEYGATTIVTQSLEGNSSDCIFDLDSFIEDSKGIPETDIWERLNHLRNVKNRLFFESLTPAAVERFK